MRSRGDLACRRSPAAGRRLAALAGSSPPRRTGCRARCGRPPDVGPFADVRRSMNALGRYGRPEEPAAAIAFLAGPEAGFVTGTTLNVDGGFNV
ncbi:SDR family oxidoreductase [Nonomuraea jiangxiensis]